MAQSLEVNIKTTSDVPKAMDKAKSATVSFGKQVDDIQKKFSTAFKDIFLGFTAPMILVNGLMRFVTNKIEENRKKQEEATQAAIDGTNELISKEEQYWARKRDLQRKANESQEQAKLSSEQIAKDFLLNTREGAALLELKTKESQKPGFLRALEGVTGSREQQAELLAKSPEIQAAVRVNLMEMQKKDPLAAAGARDFKGPEGFGNVIGVGPNPVLEAMNSQLEEAKKTNTLLEKIAGDPGATSWMNSTPSRAALLMGK